MQNMSLSVGYLDNATRLLKVVENNPDSNLTKINAIMQTDDIIIRGNSKNVLSFALEVEWIKLNSRYNVLVNTDLREYLNGDVILLQRELFWKYISNKQPIWTKSLLKGLKVKNSISDVNERQIFNDLGLFTSIDSTDDSLIQWWSRAKSLARSIENKQLTEIGNFGEKLSLAYEKERTEKNPLHVAYLSDSFGYDIESIHGKKDISPLFIEVKASTKNRQFASFYITRNEYETCKKQGSNYIFHLWRISPKKNNLIIVKGDEILSKLPIDSEGGKWEVASVAFNQFNWDNCISFEVVS